MRYLLAALVAAAAFTLSGCVYAESLALGGAAGVPLVAQAAARFQQRSLAPDFSFTLFDGTTKHLSDYRGKPVVLNFWADWCPPCVGELPEFDAVYAQRRGQFVLLAVAVQSAKDPQGFVKQNGYKLDFATDSGGGADLYGVQGIPTSLFIDRKGRVVDQVVGGMDRAEFEQHLAGIL